MIFRSITSMEQRNNSESSSGNLVLLFLNPILSNNDDNICPTSFSFLNYQIIREHLTREMDTFAEKASSLYMKKKAAEKRYSLVSQNSTNKISIQCRQMYLLEQIVFKSHQITILIYLFFFQHRNLLTLSSERISIKYLLFSQTKTFCFPLLELWKSLHEELKYTVAGATVALVNPYTLFLSF